MSDFDLPASKFGPSIPRTEAIKALQEFGGHFASNLGKALQYADGSNLRKIYLGWETEIRRCHEILKGY